TGAGDELAGIAPERGWSGPPGADLLSQQFLAWGDGGAVEHPGEQAQERGRVVPQRRGQERKGERVAGDTAEPACGRGEDQPPHTMRAAECELLGHSGPE